MREVIKVWVFLKLGLMSLLCLFLSCDKDSDRRPEYEPVLLKYAGIWEDNLNQNGLEISLRVSNREEEHLFSGNLFFNKNFEEDTNGVTVISYERDRNNFLGIKIDQDIAFCRGLFTGSGVVVPGGNILFEITGEDCNGVRRGVMNLVQID